MRKEHTLSKYIIEEEQCLQEAWKEGKEKNLDGDDLFHYVEKRSLDLWKGEKDE